jgi:F-type H+-transporting ATPase subunit gamma
MVNASEIEGRIDSVKNVRKITRTMKAVASAKLNRAQKRIEQARDYSRQMESVIRKVLGRHPGIDHELFYERSDEEDGVDASDENEEELEDSHPAYVMMCGDRGLCGSYNSKVFTRTEEQLDRSAQASLYIVGGQGINYFQRHDAPVKKTYQNIWDDLDYELSMRISDRLISDFKEGDVTSVTLIFQEFESAMVQHVREYPLLPLSRKNFYDYQQQRESEDSAEDTDDFDENREFDFEYEPDAETLINRLFPRHVRTQVYTALLDAYAALQGARMVAMDNANENANEMIDDLTLEYNQARQSSITREIADITGGAEALREE